MDGSIKRIKNLKNRNYLVSFGIFFALLPLFILLPSEWQVPNYQSLKYVILAILNVGAISYICFSVFKNNAAFNIQLADLFFFLFVIWGFLSSFWAINISSSMFYSFAWLNGYLFYKSFQIFFQKRDNIVLIENVLCALFCVVFCITLFHAFSTKNIVLKDNYLLDHLKVNANGLVSILLCLFPFLLNKIGKHITALLALPLSLLFFYFVLKNDVQSAKFALITITSFYFLAKIFKLKTMHIFLVFLCLAVLNIVIFQLNTRYLWWPEIARVSNNFGVGDRISMWSQSLDLFKEHFLNGIGNGNWFFEFGQHAGKVNTSNFRHPHNLFIQILTELGLVGLMLFLLSILTSLIKLIKQKKYLAFALASLVFLILSFFFGITNFNYNYCGSAILVFLISIAVPQHKQQYRFSKIHALLLLIFSIISLLWFYENLRVENKLLEVRQRSIEKSKIRIALVEDIFHPYKKTHFKNIPLPYYAIKDIDNMKPITKKYAAKRDSFYQLLNVIEPNSTRYQHMYAEHLYEKGDLFNSKKILQKLISQSENYLFSRLLLAKIEAEFGNYNFADALLNFDSVVFEKALIIENRYYLTYSKKLHLNDKKFLELNKELIQLKKKIKRKLRQQKLQNN